MSINFEKPVDQETIDLMRAAFGKSIADDRKTFLYDDPGVIERKVMSKIAKSAQQPVTVEYHSTGDIKTMSDGTRYRVTPQGWQKIEGESP